MAFSNTVDNYLSQQLLCDGVVSHIGNGEYLVRGEVKNGPKDALVIYWAANPPTFSTSYNGSALPYANPTMAYENTPNKGSVRANNGRFEFYVNYPNSYYIGLGTVYVKPHVNIRICDKKVPGGGEVHRIELGDGVPFRSLTYAPPPDTYPRYSPMFYSGGESLPVRTQEEILRSAAYPDFNVYPKNFWGQKPPM